MRAAVAMETLWIHAELEKLAREWDEFRAECDGMAGSPGEWMIERMDELETELKRRKARV